MAMTPEEFMRAYKDGTLARWAKKHGERCADCGKPPGQVECLRRVGTGRNRSKGKIQIVKVPAGEAPLSIRRKWLGLIMDAHCFESKHRDGSGVISGKSIRTRARYLVMQWVAIEELEERDPAAASWWKEHGFPKDGELFAFNATEVVEIKPVSPRL